MHDYAVCSDSGMSKQCVCIPVMYVIYIPDFRTHCVDIASARELLGTGDLSLSRYPHRPLEPETML